MSTNRGIWPRASPWNSPATFPPLRTSWPVPRAAPVTPASDRPDAVKGHDKTVGPWSLEGSLQGRKEFCDGL